MIKLSKAGKMPCKSWSLPAFYSCPGSYNDTIRKVPYSGKLEDFTVPNEENKENRLPTCSGCYAMEGHYCYSNVKNLREHNLEDWKRKDWVRDMVSEIKDMAYFRFFDSGDIYCIELAEKIKKLCIRCKNTKFWIPTLSWRIPGINKVLEEINNLPNVVVRKSSGRVETEDTYSGRTSSNISTVIPETELGKQYTKTNNRVVCRSFERGGKCKDCRACWSKKVQTIFYVAHGKVMKKKVKEMKV